MKSCFWLDGMAKLNVVQMKDLVQFPILMGQAVIVSERVVRKHLLTSVSAIRLERRLGNVKGHEERFSRDLEMKDEPLAKLDERGLVKLGSAMVKGDILAGVIREASWEELSEEEKLLYAIFGPGTSAIKESSLCYDFADSGIVTRVNQGSPKSVEVEIVIRRELQVGDLIRFPDGEEFTVATIVPETEMDFFFRDAPVDVLIGPEAKTRLRGFAFLRHKPKKRWKNWFKTNGELIKVAKETRQAEEKTQVRGSGGYYSIITCQPKGDGPNPAQLLTWPAIRALLHNGYPENVRELLTIKSDAIEGRTRVYEEMVKGQPVSLAEPWSTSHLKFVLQAMGFSFKVVNDSLEIKPLSDEEARGLSYGAVMSPETLDYRTLKPIKDGLFCERTFGPTRNWECACGKYKGIKHQNIICDKCLVKITHSKVRRERFGHIRFPRPIIHPWLLPRIAEVLGESIGWLCQCIQENGVETIRERLQHAGVSADGLIMDNIPVLPPNLRPVCQDEDGTIYSSDLNDLYRRVVNRSKRFQNLIDLNAPAVILANEYHMLQKSVHQLISNLESLQPVIGTSNRPLSSLRQALESAVYFSQNKRSDYSAKAVVVPDPNVAEGNLGISLDLLIPLFFPTLIHVLKSASLADTIKGAIRRLERRDEEIMATVQQAATNQWLLVLTEHNQCLGLKSQIIDGEVVRLNPVDAQKLGLSFNPSSLKLFAPLGQKAKEECANPRPVDDLSSNLDLEHLLEACQKGNTIPLTYVDKIILGIE